MNLLMSFVVIVGFAVVSADLSEENHALQMLVRELLGNEAGDLDLEAKDMEAQCNRATNNCNGMGRCVEGRWGDWYCRCNKDARVSGPQSTCVPKAKREEGDLEMEARDSLAYCQSETGNCNGNGVCRASRRYTDQFICICDPGFKPDNAGSCVAQTKRELASLDMSLRNSQALCESDTNSCNGAGECLEGRFGWRCQCDNYQLYTIDRSGACVLRTRSLSAENDTEGMAKRLLALLSSKK